MFHSLIAAYGQRRGYAMSDLTRMQESEAGLFSSTVANAPTSNFTPASNLTLNLVDASTYSNELRLFLSFYNSLPVVDRQNLRSVVDGMIAFFSGRLSTLGRPLDSLLRLVEDFNFPNDSDLIRVGGFEKRSASLGCGDLLKKFLMSFDSPHIYEYLRSETDILSRHRDVGISNTTPMEESSDGDESEKDDADDPAWWKSDVKLEVEEAPDDLSQEKDDDDVDALIRKIRNTCSSAPLETTDQDSLPFNYSLKLYSLGGCNSIRGRSNPRPTPVCADLALDASMACFGYDGDSSVQCFRLRRLDGTGPNASIPGSVSTLLRTGSNPNTVYRVRILGGSLDGRFVLTASDDNSYPVQLFNLDSREKIYDYCGHQWPVWALDATEKCGGIFLSGSYDKTARLFLLDRKYPVRIFVGHEASVDFVKILEHSQGAPCDYPLYVCTASSDRTIRLWSLNDAVPVRVFHGIKGLPTALAYRLTPSNGCSERLVACATTEGKIFIWEMDTGRTYQILDGVLAYDLQFSPDGSYLVAGGESGCFKIYRLAQGQGELSQYVDMQVLENNAFHNFDSKFLATRFVGDDLVCLTT